MGLLVALSCHIQWILSGEDLSKGLRKRRARSGHEILVIFQILMIVVISPVIWMLAHILAVLLLPLVVQEGCLANPGGSRRPLDLLCLAWIVDHWDLKTLSCSCLDLDISNSLYLI